MSKISNRRSIRLREYDYSQSGAYFVTICTRERECLLGQIEHGQVVLSEAGEIAQSVWLGLSNRFPSVTLDEYVIMPNHIHGIVLVGA
jgi:REP element-mobilizing transposase RayT